MLTPMNRLMRQLAAGAFAVAALTSLTACADGPPPQGAASPTRQSMQASGWVDSTASTDGTVVAQADVGSPVTEEANPTQALPTSADTSGPLPPLNTATQTNSSVEPPSPSEYDSAADTDPAALSDFREPLAPYGSWVDDGTYGTVWVPSSTVVGADFTPYVSDGHWGLTDDGSWIWVSDYSWGWAPFHYGRWVWIGGRGWAWIPGRVYSPAWVVWRTGYYDDYYVGWAPMPPVWYWRGGLAMSLWYVPPAPYVFCSSRYVFAPRVRGYIVPAGRVGAIGPRTRPYVAATAGVAGSTYRAASATRGPSMADAHIPAAGIPASRVSHDPRAMAFSRAAEPSRSFQSRTLGAQPQPGVRESQFSRNPALTQPAPTNGFTRPGPTPADASRRVAPSFAGSRPLPNMPSPRPSDVPRPISPSIPASPRFSGSPAPVAPRSFGPSPAPFAPRSFAPSPAPVGPRSFTPAPAAPRSPPSARSNSPGRAFGGRR